MARLILKSPYIKSTGGASGYLRYIATRERVELIPDDRPPTRKQEQLIAKLVKDFPDSKTLYEYEDYLTKPTKVRASTFITLALEANWDAIHESDQYMKYIATRPHVERIGTHGLFGDDDAISLDRAMEELERYTGNVWTHIISLQITPNPRYKDKYIVEMTEAEKSFNETTSYAFGIPLNLCTSVEQTRERIRNKMKEFSFPIWTIKSILPSMELKTGRAILEELIDSYCGIANSNNMGKSKTDSDIALAIGDLSAKNPDAKEDLRILLTKDNCTAGMRAYVQEFDGSELVTLAEEIGDNGQYINVLRSKFDADAANWVWNVETACDVCKQ